MLICLKSALSALWLIPLQREGWVGGATAPGDVVPTLPLAMLRSASCFNSGKTQAAECTVMVRVWCVKSQTLDRASKADKGTCG